MKYIGLICLAVLAMAVGYGTALHEKQVEARNTVQLTGHVPIVVPKIEPRLTATVTVTPVKKTKKVSKVTGKEPPKIPNGARFANHNWCVADQIVDGSNALTDWSDLDRPMFQEHVLLEGQWIILNFYHDKYQKQCLFLMKGMEIQLSSLMSGAINTDGKEYFLPSDQHPDSPLHNHLGLFCITHKKVDKYSKKYNCSMPYSMFYLNGEGQAIHACQPKDAKRLGKPASHGCNRVDYRIAPALYTMVDLGYGPVYVANVCLKATKTSKQ